MKWWKIIFLSLLLAGGAILCVIRWQAWFGTPNPPVWNGEKSDYVIPQLTARNDSISDNSTLTMLVLGDIHNKLTYSDYNTISSRIPHLDGVIQTGDWLDRGQEYYRQLLLREWTQSDLFGLPVVTTPGNHEYSKGIGKKISPVWLKTFGLDSCPENKLPNVPGMSYYVDLPQARFIVIDTNPLERLVYLTRTLTWLTRALDTAEGRYTIVLMHHPVLSAAKGHFYPLLYSTFRITLGRADLVLAGHDHSYMRRTPFVVINTGGTLKPQHDPMKADCHTTHPAYGVLTIEPSPASTLKFISYRLDNGEVIDSLYVSHN